MIITWHRWLFFVLGIFIVRPALVAGGFEERMLEQHNEFRGIHNSWPLKLDDDLTKKANEIVRDAAKTGKFFQGADNNEAGVNTMTICASYKRRDESAKDIVSSWYDEVCGDGFSFSDPNTMSKALAFTQLIWKDSKLLGVAKATSKEEKETCTYIAAVYRPSGNIDSLFKENVKEGEFKKEYCSKFAESS